MVQVLEIIISAFNNIFSYKIRSFLTMFGIVIGVGAVITITGIGNGVKASIFNELNSINKNIVTVTVNSNSSNNVTITNQENNNQQNDDTNSDTDDNKYKNIIEEDSLTLDDSKDIAKLPGIETIVNTSYFKGKVMLKDGKMEGDSIITAIDNNFRSIDNFNMSYGRFINDADINNSSRVAVIKDSTSMDVFGKINSVGEKLEVETEESGVVYFTVIGVIDENNLTTTSKDILNDAVVIIPITTSGDIFLKRNNIDVANIKLKAGTNTNNIINKISQLLDKKYDKEDGYSVRSQDIALDSIDSVFNSITAFVSFVAAISLFVGGVGVMNIMTVTVTERTVEIGIRKSLGSTNGLIQFQFLMESIIITIMGGILGVILGFICNLSLSKIINIVSPLKIIPNVHLSVIIGLIIVSVLIGIIFGVAPARKAAKLDPVLALRFE